MPRVSVSAAFAEWLRLLLFGVPQAIAAYVALRVLVLDPGSQQTQRPNIQFQQSRIRKSAMAFAHIVIVFAIRALLTWQPTHNTVYPEAKH